MATLNFTPTFYFTALQEFNKNNPQFLIYPCLKYKTISINKFCTLKIMILITNKNIYFIKISVVKVPDSLRWCFLCETPRYITSTYINRFAPPDSKTIVLHYWNVMRASILLEGRHFSRSSSRRPSYSSSPSSGS